MSTLGHISDFLTPHFGRDFQPSAVDSEEELIITHVLEQVDFKITKQKRPAKYLLGLAVDFTILAQRLSLLDSSGKKFRKGLTERELFKRYRLIAERAGQTANTLSLSYKNKAEGIRAIEESVCAFFNNMDRTGYPSAYVYNTGQWRKFTDLLVECFRLSENGRYDLCVRLLRYGLDLFPKNKFFGRENPRVRLFELLLTDYPRSNPNENAGLVFQAIAYGFFAADRPHLSIIADKVRTGSARQKRIGDIDCYDGLDLEASVEVKDIAIDQANLDRELGGFRNKVKAQGILGIAFVAAIDEATHELLTNQNVLPITLNDVLWVVERWDWAKQDSAMQGVLHHIAHIEQNTHATQRLLDFIHSHDEDYDALVYRESSN